MDHVFALKQSGGDQGIDFIGLQSTPEEAVLVRLELIEAIMRADGGKAVQLSEIAATLKAAPVGYIVPEHAAVTALNAVIRGVARWRRVLGLY